MVALLQALIDAGIAMKEYVVACTAVSLDGTAVLDCNQQEANAQGAELMVAVLYVARRAVLLLRNRRPFPTPPAWPYPPRCDTGTRNPKKNNTSYLCSRVLRALLLLLLLLLARPKSGQIISTQMSSRIHVDHFEALLNLAQTGCDTLYGLLREKVLERTASLATATK